MTNYFGTRECIMQRYESLAYLRKKQMLPNNEAKCWTDKVISLLPPPGSVWRDFCRWSRFSVEKWGKSKTKRGLERTCRLHDHVYKVYKFPSPNKHFGTIQLFLKFINSAGIFWYNLGFN
jgi:hypothetical protein